jgi:small subunit ribosomal protein S8
MTDPIADMLTRIRNANSAMFDTVKMPSSKLKENLAKVLEREGFIKGFTVTKSESKPGSTLEVALKYSVDRRKTIVGIKRVSKPGLRIYKKSDQMP